MKKWGGDSELTAPPPAGLPSVLFMLLSWFLVLQETHLENHPFVPGEDEAPRVGERAPHGFRGWQWDKSRGERQGS